MHELIDISFINLALFYLMLIVPIGISYYLKVGVIKETIIATVRMTIQLFLIGIVLKFLFEKDSNGLNILWFLVMTGFATYSVLNNSDLKIKPFVIPVFSSLLFTGFSMIFIFDYFLLELSNAFDARYFIILGGMMVGNSLQINTIGLSHFVKTMKKNENEYLYYLSLGTSTFKASKYFIADSVKLAVSPMLASIATIGIVFIPGMMSGQIISGAPTETAIEYQIAIYIAIFSTVFLSLFLSILFCLNKIFNDLGVLDKGIFPE